MSKPKKPAKKRSAPRSRTRWSQEVTEHSDALDLERDVFTLDDPEENRSLAEALRRA